MVDTSSPLIELDMGQAETLQRLEWLAWFTDSSMTIPGTRRTFGVDALLSFIPGVGSLLGGGISAYLLMEAVRHAAPPPVLARMGINVLADTALGAIPVVGIVFDILFKANQRNLKLLRQHLAGETQ